uniref:Chromobox protein homolog 5 n=1 Tax=Cacopsylla melanoneura TaxID=428564 RepID=A0A8D8Z0L7_9HEMI
MKTKVRGRRPRWSGPQMESAMNSVIVEGGSIQAAARLFNIPQCTLSKYVQHRTNKKPKRGPRIGWKRSSIEDPHNTNSGFGSPVKKRRGRKRKLPLANVEPEEIAYNGNKLNNGVNEDVAKEKLLNDMNLGIDRNLPVEQIIGASIELGFPAFLVTWEGSDEADLLPAELCKRKYPQPLIKFFEKHLTFPLD